MFDTNSQPQPCLNIKRVHAVFCKPGQAHGGGNVANLAPVVGQDLPDAGFSTGCPASHLGKLLQLTLDFPSTCHFL